MDPKQKADGDNRSRQLNDENDEYWKSRGEPRPPNHSNDKVSPQTEPSKPSPAKP